MSPGGVPGSKPTYFQGRRKVLRSGGAQRFKARVYGLPLKFYYLQLQLLLLPEKPNFLYPWLRLRLWPKKSPTVDRCFTSMQRGKS